jgi:hypothetical protein
MPELKQIIVQRMAMKAWRLDRLGGTLRFEDAPIPEAAQAASL